MLKTKLSLMTESIIKQRCAKPPRLLKRASHNLAATYYTLRPCGNEPSLPWKRKSKVGDWGFGEGEWKDGQMKHHEQWQREQCNSSVIVMNTNFKKKSQLYYMLLDFGHLHDCCSGIVG
jgi:hypothetical protein